MTGPQGPHGAAGLRDQDGDGEAPTGDGRLEPLMQEPQLGSSRRITWWPPLSPPDRLLPASLLSVSSVTSPASITWR